MKTSNAMQTRSLPKPPNVKGSTTLKLRKSNKKKSQTSPMLTFTLRKNAFDSIHREFSDQQNSHWSKGHSSKPKADVIIDVDGIPTAADFENKEQAKGVAISLDDGPKQKPFTIRYVFYVVVSSNTTDDLGVLYAVKGNQSFKDIYKDYAEKVDCRVKDMVLTNMRTGGVISPGSIAKYVGLRRCDMLVANHKNPEANMNAGIKVFYIAPMNDKPNKVKVDGRLDTYLSNLYHFWGCTFNVNPKTIMLINQSRVLNPNETIESAKIRNNGVVYALPKVRFHRNPRISN